MPLSYCTIQRLINKWYRSSSVDDSGLKLDTFWLTWQFLTDWQWRLSIVFSRLTDWLACRPVPLWLHSLYLSWSLLSSWLSCICNSFSACRYSINYSLSKFPIHSVRGVDVNWLWRHSARGPRALTCNVSVSFHTGQCQKSDANWLKLDIWNLKNCVICQTKNLLSATRRQFTWFAKWFPYLYSSSQ